MSATASALRTPRALQAPRSHPARPRLRVVEAAPVRRVRWGAWVLALLVASSLFAAVAFHVVLAQGQLELDRVARLAAVERQRYQQQRLAVAQESSPAWIVARAHQLGLVDPAGPPSYVTVPNAPPPPAPHDGTSTTLQDGWEKVKPHLGNQP